jgi:hypothetical protein
MLTNRTPFPIDPALSQISLAYTNGMMVADSVLPRVSVLTEDFRYNKFTFADSTTIPNTRVGRKGRPSQVEFSVGEGTSHTDDYGLDYPIPYADIEKAQRAGIDITGRATRITTQLVMLDREVRVATLMFDPNNYGTNNKATLAGTSQFSDYTNSDPIQDILGRLDSCIVRPNVAVMGRAVWTKLQSHPKVVAAAYPMGGNASVGGKAAREAVARLLELDEIIVGEGFFNSAKPGQAPTNVRVWGKHISLFVRNQDAAPDAPICTFGYTAQWGDRVAGQIQDPHLGLRGGTSVRVGESVKELLIANDLAFLLQNAVA